MLKRELRGAGKWAFSTKAARIAPLFYICNMEKKSRAGVAGPVKMTKKYWIVKEKTMFSGAKGTK